MIKSFETFNHVARAALPIFDLSISLHSINEMRATVLHRYCVAVAMEPCYDNSLAFTLFYINITHIFVNIFIASVS